MIVSGKMMLHKLLGRAWIFPVLAFFAAIPAHADLMTEVAYSDEDPGAPSYVTRYLVTDHYLRMDYGQDGDDFVLFDRTAKRLYNVSRSQKEIMVIDASKLTFTRPEKWDVHEELVIEREDHMKRLKVYVNDTLCSRLTVAPKIFPDMVQALKEMKETLAETQGLTYFATPPEQRNICDLAQNVLEPGFWLSLGFPVDQIDNDGFTRRLINSGRSEVRAGLFELPKGYRIWNIKDMQGR